MELARQAAGVIRRYSTTVNRQQASREGMVLFRGFSYRRSHHGYPAVKVPTIVPSAGELIRNSFAERRIGGTLVERQMATLRRVWKIIRTEYVWRQANGCGESDQLGWTRLLTTCGVRLTEDTIEPPRDSSGSSE
jgi:hypothetical protein